MSRQEAEQGATRRSLKDKSIVLIVVVVIFVFGMDRIGADSCRILTPLSGLLDRNFSRIPKTTRYTSPWNHVEPPPHFVEKSHIGCRRCHHSDENDATRTIHLSFVSRSIYRSAMNVQSHQSIENDRNDNDRTPNFLVLLSFSQNIGDNTALSGTCSVANGSCP